MPSAEVVFWTPLAAVESSPSVLFGNKEWYCGRDAGLPPFVDVDTPDLALAVSPLSAASPLSISSSGAVSGAEDNSLRGVD